MEVIREPIPPEDESVLIENREELVRQLIPSDIINSLLQRRVIDLDDFKAISRKERTDRRAGVGKLLDRIHRSGPHGLVKFIDSLKSSGYPGLANKLQESRQTINRTEQETPQESSANKLQESQKTITNRIGRRQQKVSYAKGNNFSYRSRFKITEKDAAAKSTTNDTRCIILLGKNGVGKSSLGNYLLGAQKFSTSIMEDSGTKVCQIGRTDHMVVVDTPGFFPMLGSDFDVAKEIVNTIKLNYLLINVYILVLSAVGGAPGDRLKSVEFIKKLFGEKVFNNMIIVFTGKDLLKDDKFQFSRHLPKLPYFLLDCEHRKQEEEVEMLCNEIFSQKYKNIPGVFDEDHVDWASIRSEDRRRKDFTELESSFDKIQNNLKLLVNEITDKYAAAKSTTNDTRCIILLGKNGVGKSSLGNYLLGAQKFSTTCSIMEDSGTKVCQIERTDHMVVVDTPGFFPMLGSDFDVAKEIVNTIQLNYLLINVYILVLSAVEGAPGNRLKSVEFIKKLFGENVFNNMIIVFTGEDLLKDDKFLFSRHLPKLPYFLLDCKHRKQEEVEMLWKEIFSQKYKNIPGVFDWASIGKEKTTSYLKGMCIAEVPKLFNFRGLGGLILPNVQAKGGTNTSLRNWNKRSGSFFFYCSDLKLEKN